MSLLLDALDKASTDKNRLLGAKPKLSLEPISVAEVSVERNDSRSMPSEVSSQGANQQYPGQVDTNVYWCSALLR